MNKTRKKRGGRLLLIQTVLCAVLLLAVAALRLSGGETYKQLRTLYWQQMNQTVSGDIAADAYD